MTKRKDIPLYHFPKRSDELPIIISKIAPGSALSWDSKPDRHTYFMIFWITSGKGMHFIDFDGYPINPYSLYLLRPGQTHFFVVEKPLKGVTIQFTEELLQLNRHPGLDASGLELFYLISRKSHHQLTRSQAKNIQSLFDQLYAEYELMQFGQLPAIQHLLQLLFIQIHRLHQSSVDYKFPLASDLLTAHFQQLVDDQFATIHRVQRYADILGVTAGHLSAAVKSVLGMPASYLIRRRTIIEAKRLLAYSQLTTSEISGKLGFKDASYFCRYFKRETTLSPLTFRASYHEKYHHHPTKSLH